MLYLTEVDQYLLRVYEETKLLPADDPDALMEALVALDTLKRNVAEMAKTVEERLAPLMTLKAQVEHGDFVLEKRSSAPRRKWDNEGLAPLVAARIIQMHTDMDTGEMPLSPQEVAIEMLRYAAPSYWRVGELSNIGISADQFCEVGDATETIQIKRKK